MTINRVKRLSFCCLSFILVLVRSWASLTQETVYATWQQNPSTSMTIQWISSSKEKESAIAYRLGQEKGDWVKVQGEFFPFPHASYYLIHRVELKNLQPDQEYHFKVLPYEEEYHFLTVPKNLEKELRFVVGGDMYHDGLQLMATTCQKAAETNPAFALIGGDIAYAVTSRYFSFQKIDRWIAWIKVWHSTMITHKGYLIPVIAAIGNHDLIRQYDQTPAQAAIFNALFPSPGNQMYRALDFNAYLTIFILDSGHAHPIGGEQSAWLGKALSARQGIPHRFALYHVPAYPSIRNFQNKQSTAIRQSWVPLFEKWGLQVAFEHHDHAYKRTYPLLANRIHPEGVIYVGDGGWGVEKPRKPILKRYFLAKFAAERHFIAVKITPTEQKFTSINYQGRIIDEWIKPIK